MKTKIRALGAKIIKSIALLFGLWSMCAQGAGFSGEHYAQLDLDENPIVVTNVTFDGLINNVAFTTWAELKSLRDGGGLKSGQQYRITNYVATTVQEHTQSANHPFDIIVTADSTNKLNEVARAIRHEGDTYFPETTKFEAWKIWYSLDNNTNRFEWADSANGKGVIYRMIDEWVNDVPYDFKGIKMQAYLGYDEDSDQDVYSKDYRYTFGGSEDQTVKADSLCHSNKMEVRFSSRKQMLNQNTFGEYCYRNTFGSGCYRNTFGSFCYNNTFGSSCYRNTFGSNCYGNTFGSGCYDNTFGSHCYNNTFGSYCCSIKFGTASSVKSNCRYIRVGSGNQYLYINPTGSSSQYYQNVEIKEGVNNTTTYKTIADPNVGQTFHTTYKPANSQEISL